MRGHPMGLGAGRQLRKWRDPSELGFSRSSQSDFLTDWMWSVGVGQCYSQASGPSSWRTEKPPSQVQRLQ